MKIETQLHKKQQVIGHFLTLKIKLFATFILFATFLFSCSNKKEKKRIKDFDTNYVDPMISEVLTDKALGESWDLMKQGQQLADDGIGKDEIIRTFPKNTLFQTNSNSIVFFIEGSMPMVIRLDRKSKQKRITKGSGFTTKNFKNLPLLNSNLLTINNQGPQIDYSDVIDVVGSDRNDDERQKKKALIIAPYNSTDFKNIDDADIAYKYLRKNRNYAENIVFLKDNVSLDDFASFGNYDLVHLSTHGENYCELKKTGLDENGWAIIEKIPYKKCRLSINTNIHHGFTDLKKNKEEKAKARELYGKYKGLIRIDSEEIYLLNSFFFNTFKNLENKIWIFSACELGSNNFFEATIDYIHTNGHFLYWLNSVGAKDSYKAFDKFYENLSIKGLDVSKAYEKIPTILRENLSTTVDYTTTVKDTIYRTNPKTKEKEFKIVDKDTTITKNAKTRLMHLQTDDPRHGIEIIDMLIPETKEMVVLGDYYPITGDFNDGKDEALTLKVKLIGYTKAEFTEKQMSISLEVDGVSVLNHKPFLPDVEDDEITIEPLKEHKFGIIVTINDISIPDVGDKKELTLKAILHLNDKHVSIHKELVSIVANGITATMKESGMTLKYIYDNKTKAVKVISSDGIMYYDNEGTIYMKDEYGKWMKMKNGGMNMGQLANMPSFIPLTSNDKEEIQNMSSGLPPFIKFAINFRMISFETNNQFEKSLVDCGLPIKCNKFTNSQGMYAIFNTAGKLIEYSFGKGVTIKYKYGDYNVKLPKANLFKMPVINYRAAEQELKKQGINLNFN